MVMCVHAVPEKKTERFYQVIFAQLQSQIPSAFLSVFLAPCVVFPYRARIKTGNSFYFSKKRLAETNSRNIFLTTAIRELINYELTFFPDKQLRSTCPSNEGSRFLETYVTKTSVNPLLFPLRQRKN